jgi:hypothetical protein
MAQVMSAIKQMRAETPVEEPLRDRGVTLRTTEAADRHRGTPQGGVISPSASQRLLQAVPAGLRKLGHQERFDSVVVNYADDFVICCRRGNGPVVVKPWRQS